PIASSATRSANRSDSSGAEICVHGTKSTVPANLVFRPSVAKRVMLRMPDLPAVRFFQFSYLPAPSEVTTPMPVTTTTGRPALSWEDDICSPSGRRFEQREAFATPMSDRGDDRLGQRAFHGPLHARVVAWSEQTTMAQRERGE